MGFRMEDRYGSEISELDLERLTEGSFRIKNTGNGVLTWAVSLAGTDWLSLGDKRSGSLQAGATATITLTVNRSLLTEGDNQTTVNIRTNAGDKQLPVKAYRLQLSDALPEMVYVEGGTFMMGATEEQGSDAWEWEKPAHEVTLDNFYIGKYEITQLQWEFVMGTTVKEQHNISFAPPGVGDDYPMYYVSWNEAVAFCEKLSQLTGKTYRLPTEAEWEYAARGGLHADSTKYAGSNTIGNVAWYKNNSSNTHPVGQKQPNGLGVYDMSGNVREWCSDWIGENYYSSSPAVNPQGPSSGSSRVFRGGNWRNSADECRVSMRTGSSPNGYNIDIGFRIVLEP